MGKVAKWLDSLTDAERDRIIQHPDPTYVGRSWWDYERNCGCLVGCVKGRSEHKPSPYDPLEGSRLWFDQEAEIVGLRFTKISYRLGAERAWRICKARAAKGNALELPAVTEEAAVAV